MIEGFDTQAIGVAAPMLFREFSITPSQGGLIFSAATLGLFLGAAIGGRAADYVGRELTLIVSLILFGLCSLLTAAVHGTALLIAVRLLTGLGLGGAMPNFIALAADAANPGRRLGTMTMVMAALPFGGALAGVMALGDRLGWGWRSIFIVGGVAPILVAIAVLSVSRTSASARARSSAAPARADVVPIDRVGTVLWGGDRARTTLLLWSGFFFTTLVLFLMLNWLPSLIIGLGFSHDEATVASIAFNLAGSLGSAWLGRFHGGAHRRSWVLATYGGIASALVVLATVAALGRSFSVMMSACVLAGIFIVGAQLILYALAPLYYRRANRATGVGAAVAVGRLGSVAGPLFASTLLASGGASATVLAGIIPFVVVAGAAAFALSWRPQSVD